MMFDKFLVQYMLQDVFHEHVEEYAEWLGQPQKSVSHWLWNFREKGSCPKLCNLTLDMCARKPDMLRDIAAQYALVVDLGEEDEHTCLYYSDMERALSSFSSRSECSAHEKRLEVLHVCARAFIRAIASVYCGRNPERFAGCTSFQEGDPNTKPRNQSARTRPCSLLLKLVKLLSTSVQCPSKARCKNEK